MKITMKMNKLDVMVEGGFTINTKGNIRDVVKNIKDDNERNMNKDIVLRNIEPNMDLSLDFDYKGMYNGELELELDMIDEIKEIFKLKNS